MKKRMILFLALIFCMSVFSSCKNSGDGEDGTFYTVIYDNPENLDPQLATDENSLSVLRNIFEGLTAVSKNGEIVCAAAESCDVSEDKLTYVFTLRRGMMWYSAGGYSSEVTAKDYVYAFKRIFSPEMHSPYRERFSAVKNSEAVYNGVMSANDLGVKAVDDYTVKFTLEYPDADFPYLLSTAAAYPCSEEFFLSTNGRYGLSAKYSAGNGAFFLTEWNYDPYWNENFLTLKRASDNSTEDRKTYPAYVNYIISDSIAEYEEMSGNTVNVYALSADEKPLKLRGKNVAGYPSVTAGIIFNYDSEFFSDENVRKALALSADISVFEGKTSDGIYPAHTAVPPAVICEGQSLCDLFGAAPPKSGNASEYWEKKSSQTPELSSIIVSEDFADAPILYMLTDSWEQELSFSCGVEILDNENYEKRLESGEYDMALTFAESGLFLPSEFYKSFEKYITDENDLSDFTGFLREARNSFSAGNALKNYKHADSLVTDNAYFIPVFYESYFLITQNDVDGVLYDPFAKTLDFKNARKY